MDDTMTTTSKRNFYLMLSPPDGQEIAMSSGFYPSSEDVYEEEQKDILRSWSILTATGVVESLSDAADWMADIMVNDSMLPTEEDIEDDPMVHLTFDYSDEDSDQFMQIQNVPYAELIKMHHQIKESTYNTILGCLVSSVSKLLDEELITLIGVEQLFGDLDG